MPTIYDTILQAALNRDISAMLTYRGMLFDEPCPDLREVWPRFNTFFLEVVLAPHPNLDLMTREEMMGPDDQVYPVLAERLRNQLTDYARRGHRRSMALLEHVKLQLTSEEQSQMTQEEATQLIKWRVLKTLCCML